MSAPANCSSVCRRLTQLELFYSQATAHVDFLLQLPLLTTLSLDISSGANDDSLLASLVRCTGITDLDLSYHFDSAQWSALFAKLTLKYLALCGNELGTLSCFAWGPITVSLEELTIDKFDLPPSELFHLSALRRLRTLHIYERFISPLEHATFTSLSPPSSLLPALTDLFDTWENEQGVWEYQERQGPSFEWMQERTEDEVTRRMSC